VFVQQVHEVSGLEPAVILHVRGAILEVALAFGEVCGHQVLDQALAVGREGLRESYLALDDLGLDLHGLVRVERVDPVDHFEDQDSQGPPVHRLPVALVHYNLGADLLRRPAERLGLRGTDLSEPEVGHLQLAVCVNQQVFGFEVAIDNVLGVQLLKDKRNLRSLEARLGLLEANHGAEICEEFAALNELHEELELLVVLRVALVLHAEGVGDVAHDEDLVLHVLHLLALHKFVLLQRLAGLLVPVLALS